MNKEEFDVALIPGMRERLAQAYARFRTAHATFQQDESRVATKSSERDRCPGCGAPSSEAKELFVARAMRHVRCRRCDLVFTRDILEEADDRALYQPNTAMLAYLDLKEDPAYAGLEATKAAYMAGLARRFSRDGAKFLDVGCSTGVLMKAAADAGFDVRGVEPNPDMVARAKKKLGDRVVAGYFPGALPAEWPPFDVIAILDLLEHMVEPRAFIGELASRLAPEGLLLVQVPNFSSLIIQLEGPENNNFCHGHWTHFTEATLAALLESAGFETLWRETIISELDRVRAFAPEKIRATVERLAPGYEGDGARLDAAGLHERFLGYKLVGIFRKRAYNFAR